MNVGVPWNSGNCVVASLVICTSWSTAFWSARHWVALGLRDAARRRPFLETGKLGDLHELLVWWHVLQCLELGLRSGLELTDPIRLILVERARERKEAFRAVAARDQRRSEIERIADVVAELLSDFPGLHILINERLHALLIELPAVRAGHRSELDQLNLGLRIAHEKTAGGRLIDDLRPVAVLGRGNRADRTGRCRGVGRSITLLGIAACNRDQCHRAGQELRRLHRIHLAPLITGIGISPLPDSKGAPLVAAI